jgi:hypothetical protein
VLLELHHHMDEVLAHRADSDTLIAGCKAEIGDRFTDPTPAFVLCQKLWCEAWIANLMKH